MKAVVIDKPGGPDTLRYAEDLPVPNPKDNELLIKTTYSGVNYIDTYFRSGLYPAPSLPLIIGYEGAGEVAALPPSGSNPHNFKVGDRVVWMQPGTYCGYVAVDAEKVIAVPADVKLEDALGGLLMGITALSLVKESYEVQRGDTILVHAAAGGVGLLLCQLISALGATVIGTASTEEKCETARRNGARYMINYAETADWVSEVKKLAPEGVACV